MEAIDIFSYFLLLGMLLSAARVVTTSNVIHAAIASACSRSARTKHSSAGVMLQQNLRFVVFAYLNKLHVHLNEHNRVGSAASAFVHSSLITNAAIVLVARVPRLCIAH